MATATATSPWMTARQARLTLGVSAHTALKLALAGQLVTRARPGYPLEFERASVERLAAERAAESASK